MAQDLAGKTGEAGGDVVGPRGIFSFYMQHGVSPGGDFFVIGNGSIERAGEHAAYHVAIGTEDGPLVRRTIVVMPPGSGEAEQERVGDGYRRGSLVLRPETLADEPAALSPRIEFVNAALQDADSLRDLLLSRGAEGITFIIPLAAAYRSPLPLPELVEAPEDVWVPQLVSLANVLVPIARETGSYVALDAGEFWPERESNQEALLKVDHCGVASAPLGQLTPLQMFALTKRWRELAETGALGEALAEIDATEDLSDDRKLFERMSAFRFAGNSQEALALLEREDGLIRAAPAGIRLAFAELARTVGNEALAIELLRGALGTLTHVEVLQQALRVADNLEDAESAAVLEAALNARFPRSRLLAEREAHRHLANNRRDDAAAALSATGDAHFEEEADYQRWLAEKLGVPLVDPEALLIEAHERWPDRREQNLRALAGAMEASGLRADALDMLLAGPAIDGELDETTLWAALEMLERGILTRDPGCDNDMSAAVTGATIRWLASHPTDGWTRLRLVRLLSPEILGGVTGAAVIAKVALDFGQRPLLLRPSVPVEDRARACDLELLVPFIESALERFSREPAIILGRMRLPKNELPAPAEQLVAGLLRLIEHAGEQMSDRADEQLIENCLLVATAVAPLGDEPDADLLVLRAVAGRFSLAGLTQRARDLAEQALNVAGADPHRRRVAWYSFGDIYARTGNTLEGLIGLACALACDEAADWDQMWYENHLALRLFRDLGLFALTGPILKKAREALRHAGIEASRSYWLDSIELQMRLAELDRTSLDVGILIELIERAAQNVVQVVDANDDAAPPTLMLASLVRIARDAGVDIPASAEASIAAGMERLGEAAKGLIDISAERVPSVEALVGLASRMDVARNAGDIGFDVKHLAVGASRLLDSGLQDAPEDAAYAIEALADHALRLPGDKGAARQILRHAAAPSEAARAIAVADLAVVLLGRADNGLTRVVFSGEGACCAVEPAATFSTQALAEWSTKYPYAYQDPKRDTSQDFYVSTERLGLSSLPARSVIVASAELQGFPPNLFQVERQLAGYTHRLCLAPSLEWLAAARETPPPGDHRIAAWIPDAEPEEGLPALAILADRVKDSLVKHDVALSTGEAPTKDMSGSGLAIIAAHGGVGEDKKYFRVITDDVDLALAASAFSGKISDINVVVLFVCSGGRLDKHPAANTTVGLVKQLLDRGCRAIVAPPWPLDTSIPPVWLPAFSTGGRRVRQSSTPVSRQTRPCAPPADNDRSTTSP
ncbi:hypothetical protein [Sphingomonas soli]|uniref:hypothetical protein n=1 Tax=Sphingomonas soli TaxID=266127 RepID=UPI0008297B14|nr:hypothetical protein [Sphingomonas soli]